MGDFFIAGFSILQFDGQRNIGAYRKFFQHIILLENKPYICITIGVKVLLLEIFGGNALDNNFTVVISVQTAKQVEQSRFAAAGFSQQENHSFIGKTQGYFIQCCDGYAFFGLVDFT